MAGRTASLWAPMAGLCGRKGPGVVLAFPGVLSSIQRLTSPRLCPEFVESDVSSFGRGPPAVARFGEKERDDFSQAVHEHEHAYLGGFG